MQWSDIDFDNGVIYLYRSKVSNDDFIPMTNRLRTTALPLNASGNASAAGRRPGEPPTRITGTTMFRPTGSGAASIPTIGVRISVNTPSRLFAIGINSVNVTGPDG